jgi:hypothetical protein
LLQDNPGYSYPWTYNLKSWLSLRCLCSYFYPQILFAVIT